MADERVELVIDKVVAGGDGLGRDPSGRVVFTRGALPGERVVVRITDVRRDLARGVLDDVLDPSPVRRQPPCPQVALGCGGCGWQHLEPDAQLTLKVGIVREALARTGRLPDAVVSAGPPLPAAAVRTTLRLAVDARGRVGFRAARSHRVVPTTSCLVAHPALAALLPVLRVEPITDGAGLDGRSSSPRAAARSPRPATTDARAEVRLRVGVASGERSALLTDVAGSPFGAAAVRRRRGGPGGSRRSGARSGPTDPGLRLAGLPPDVAVGPAAAVHETVAGHRFRVSAPAFFQSSPQGAEALVAAVRRAAGELAASAAHAVDAYAGVGLFAATVFGPQVRVTAIESSAAACADARVNLPGTLVQQVPVEDWRPEPAELVVADPARAGLGRDGVAVLTATQAARLVLVSCDPVAMARDARLLAGAGYRHAGSEVFDLFPHTPHVEVVTRFDRG